MIHRCSLFYKSSIGKKIIVAITGFFMFAWLLGHMLGNLQIFAGRGQSVEETAINRYASLLHENQALLWFVRFTMLGMILLHVVSTIALTIRNDKARPVPYKLKKSVEATLASRTMLFGGLVILVYLIYHLLHLTAGIFHPHLFTPGDVYGNMVGSFRIPMISVVYLIGQAALFMHLYHGAQSIPRTLGISNERHLTVISYVGITFALLITLGFSSIPIAVLAGWIT